MKQTALFMILSAGLVFIGLGTACNKTDFAINLPNKQTDIYQPYREIAVQEALAQERKMVIGNALEAYMLSYGHYPLDLSELVEAGLATTEEITSPLGQNFDYKRLTIQPTKKVMNKQTPPAWKILSTY